MDRCSVFVAAVERTRALRYALPRVRAKQLRELITASPFKPFRVHLSDGSHYDITHHEMAIIEQNTLDLGLNRDDEGIVQRLVRCAILHITKLEDFPETVAR